MQSRVNVQTKVELAFYLVNEIKFWVNSYNIVTDDVQCASKYQDSFYDVSPL